IRSFDAVVSLYALFHVPLIAQKVVLGRIRSWLRPEGSLVVITGHDPYEGTEQDWLGSGAPMFWSTASASTYRAWLEEFGFKITTQAFVPEGTGGHELFIARRRP
ncbi:MAG TPA: class I SAM-dependent methyltransferase, partial [Thermoplasmata archaeon]|nr:class I SAM-dependent methyltransferase [Thermoplasmata archaeon]